MYMKILLVFFLTACSQAPQPQGWLDPALLAGYPSGFNSPTVTYSVDACLLPFRDQLEEGLDAWRALGATMNVSNLNPDWTVGCDPRPNIANWAGITIPSQHSVQLTTDFLTWADLGEIREVFAHEFGHSLGLHHVSNPAAVMYAYSSDASHLTADDIIEYAFLAQKAGDK